ncbi:MAG: pilus assembly protein PilA [Coxiella sp. (in: Bacteria)]|nr:MAG: pilus assembly protein PilA [Coxiella sp. (in: g-proteobacteria)]
MSKECGFSIIELMIVVAIIGILVAVIIPSYQIYVRRAHYVEVVQAATPYKMSVQECFQVTNDLSECGAGKNGVASSTATARGIVKSVQITNAGKITVTPLAKYGLTLKDSYTLTPVVKRGQLLWVSGGGGVAHGYAN